MLKFLPKKLKQQSIKIKIIIINIILIVLFAFLIIFNNIYSRQLINKDFRESNNKILENIKEGINNNILDIQNILYQYSSDMNILNLTYSINKEISSNDIYKLNNIRKNLLFYKRSRKDILETFIFFTKPNIVLSSSGTASGDLFFNKIIRKDNEDFPKTYLDRNTIKPITITDVSYFNTIGSTQSYINANLFILPQKDFIIMILVDKDVLNAMVQAMILKTGDMAFAYDNKNSIYFSCFPERYKNNEKKLADEILSQSKNSFFIDQGNYTISKVKLLYENMNLLLISDNNTLYTKIYNMNLFAFILLGIFIIFDIIIYLIMNFMLYNPVRRILNRLNIMDKNCNFVILEDILSKMNQEVTSMGNLLESQKSIVEESYINKMLFEKSTSINSAKLEFIYNQFGKYSVLTCVFEDESGKPNYPIINQFEIDLAHTFEYIKIFTYSNVLTYFVKQNTSINNEFLNTVFININNDSTFIKAGISNSYSSLSNLSKAYSESKIAMNHINNGLEKTQVSIKIFNDEMVLKSEKFTLLIEEERQLVNKIINGDIKNTIEDLENIMRNNIDMPFQQQKEMHKYLGDLILVVINSKNIDINEVFPSGYLDILETVSNSHNIILVNNLLINSYSKLTSSILIKKGGLIERIISLIEKKYHDPISLDSIADELSMSSGYVSEFFKKTTGVNFIKYVHLKRIEKAKELIKNSNKNIYDIAQELGFDNVNTFIRVFKKYEGITPGLYKKSDLSS